MTHRCLVILAMVLVLPWLNPNRSDHVMGQSDKVESISERDRQRFESEVRPLLVKHCYECHSSETGRAEGGLLLDTREGSRRGGDSGPAVVPGNPNSSLLVLAIRYQNADLAMPPAESGGKLAAREIRILENWIRDGAPDPREGDTIEREQYNYEHARNWWAFQPIQDSIVPSLTGDDWSSNEIDRFIRARQKEVGVEPVADAAPETLLRRLYFDLVGLPPPVDELHSLWSRIDQGESLDTVLGELIDRLLNSEQFGVHWGRHWLDVARYAESSGRDVNATYPYAWRYRDYVIKAFNNNMPYDQFLREQIAGDLMSYESQSDRSQKLTATGFLAVGSRSLNETNQRQFSVDQADEQIDAVFQATMALTVGCARCHDHKFDPIPQRDYTAIAGIFLSTETFYGATGAGPGRNRSGGITLPESMVHPHARSDLTEKQNQAMRQEIEDLRKQLADFQQQRVQQRQQPDMPQMVQTINQVRVRLGFLEAELANYDDDGKIKPLAMGALDRPPTPTGRLVGLPRFRRQDGFGGIVDSPLLIRGEISMPSDRVPRGMLTLFGNSDSVTIPRHSSGRLELAQWITSPKNPMTARVAVNRIWYWLFGKGLVASLDNFGTTGNEPTHPELLDFMATRFASRGWNVKELIREIVTSRTYRLSSKRPSGMELVDPDNDLYAWYPQRRLTAESIRDAMLSASGRIDLSPQLASYVGRNQAGIVGQGRAGIREDLVVQDNSRARSIYLPVPRGVTNELLSVFDFPDAAAVQTLREVTNVPTQSLYLLNSMFVQEQSTGLADRILRKFPGDTFARFDDRIELAYQIAYSRQPTETEKRMARKLLATQRSIPKAAWTSLARGLLAAAEFRYLD